MVSARRRAKRSITRPAPTRDAPIQPALWASTVVTGKLAPYSRFSEMAPPVKALKAYLMWV